MISPTTQANGIATYTASGNRSLFDMLRWQITQFAPHTQYRISFTARGKGTLVSHIYPGAAVIEDGREDGKKSYTLNDDWKTFTCDFTSKDTLSGDIVKNMIFRFYEGTDDVELQVDLSSVCLQKVGGVAKNYALSTTFTIVHNPNSEWQEWEATAVTGVLEPGHYFLAYTADYAPTRYRVFDADTNVSYMGGSYNDNAAGINLASRTPTVEFDVPSDANKYKVYIHNSEVGKKGTQDVHLYNLYCLKLS